MNSKAAFPRTTRALMVLTLIVGLSLGGAVFVTRLLGARKGCLALASRYAKAEQIARAMLREQREGADVMADALRSGHAGSHEEECRVYLRRHLSHAKEAESFVDYYAALKRVYQRAASRPWVPLGPMPPKPASGAGKRDRAGKRDGFDNGNTPF